MNILHIYDYEPPARDTMGAQRLMEFLVRGQKELGHKVDHVRSEGETNLDDYDIVHFHTPIDMWKADINSKVPKILSQHGWSFKDQDPDIYAGMVKDKDRIVYLSDPHREYHQGKHVIHNFVDVGRYEYNIDAPQNYYTWIGGTDWWDRKSLPIVLQIAASTSINIVIAGSGQNQNIIRTIEDYAMQYKNIKYVGMVNGKQKNDIIKNAMATLVLPTFDACSIVIFESLACGTPIVCWSQKAYPMTPFEELLHEYVAVFCDDIADLKRKMIVGPKGIARADCARFIQMNHTSVHGAQRYIDLYEEMLK